jgi:hypothetical protein
VFLPSTLEDSFVDLAQALSLVLPAFTTSTVNMRSQGKSGIAGLANAKAIRVGKMMER